MKNIKTLKKIIKNLDKGKIRIAQKVNNNWKTNTKLKKIIIKYIKLSKKKLIKDNNLISNDIFENKFIKTHHYKNIRMTALSFVRYGAYIGKGVILMPCFINIGAYIDNNTLIDTWATIGSCAQIGKNVHISGGVGIGGVLEPINSKPVIIEDNCFIGARSEIVEGVIIKKNSVISMGVYIGASTKIYDRLKNKFYKAYVPKNSVVVPGSINYGNYSLYCPIIVKKRDKITNSKIQLNKNLRK
ncbi:2,3,4,5-tetrahydropyridine-2,6-dicarboxylate N-succinyltransferase [Candidatus Vidania fulgoroideae]|uniref:2,3,4,5-tetrahydropyridine-2,6-dicarboxylate N-succinyltransferase n=1 Tax=Candidatus Vidania fulgoroideorum TaxID=881286 RepID=A0A974X707_9PROT|nr:2,3,4,5-tetrahydropyridine-2,6-dicarboxylate N-succinyltransferase [Candidatus Vidania fulgoroideae]